MDEFEEKFIKLGFITLIIFIITALSFIMLLITSIIELSQLTEKPTLTYNAETDIYTYWERYN